MNDWSDLIAEERLDGLEPSVGLGLLRHSLADHELPESRRVFTNRTLRMGTIRHIGFDLDFTLAHYDRDAMSQLAFEVTLDRLVERYGYPKEILRAEFRPPFCRRGLMLDTEAGMVLKGSEVKSLRAKRADLEGAYASIERGELYLHKMFIGPYEQAGVFGHEPKDKRKLLVKRRELERLSGKLTMRGYTLVPLRVYFKDGWAKVELGLAKGKDVGDRREDLKRKAALDEARRAMRRGRGRR